MRRSPEEKQLNQLSELYYRSLRDSFPEEVRNHLSGDVCRIITDYAFEIPALQPLQNPVIINHPSIAPHVYSRDSVINAAHNELLAYGITGDNVTQYLVDQELPDSPRFLTNPSNQNISLVRGILQAIAQNDPARLQQALSSPIAIRTRRERLAMILTLFSQVGSLGNAFSSGMCQRI